jgi:hypothetical protein
MMTATLPESREEPLLLLVVRGGGCVWPALNRCRLFIFL